MLNLYSNNIGGDIFYIKYFGKSLVYFLKNSGVRNIRLYLNGNRFDFTN